MSCHNNSGCSPSGYPTANNECCTDVAEYTRFAYSSAQSAYANAQNAEQSAEDAAAALANAVLKTGSTMTGLLVLSGDPVTALGAATKQFVDTNDALKVSKAGDTMTGLLTLSGAPVSNLDAATKLYTDTQDALRVSKSGDTMSGSLTVQGNVSLTSPTSTLGYGIGTGGVVTQLTDKSTTVTLNRPSGQIVTANELISVSAVKTFTLVNSTISSTDVLILNHAAGNNFGIYVLNARCQNGSAQISILNEDTSSQADVLTISFVVIKGSTT